MEKRSLFLAIRRLPVTATSSSQERYVEDGLQKDEGREYKMLFSIFGSEGKVKAEEMTGEQSSRIFFLL